MVDPRFDWRAEVVMEVTKSKRKAKDGARHQPSSFECERVVEVVPPTPLPSPTEVYARVIWFDLQKGFGYVTLLGEHPFEGNSARLAAKTIPGLKPQKGDAVRVVVELTIRGLDVTMLDFGDRITAIVEAMERTSAPAEPAPRVVATPAGDIIQPGSLIPTLGIDSWGS
jgi:hypothetical protein